MSDQEVFCYVNGKKCLLPRGRGECTLLEYLRDDLGLTGAKLGCGEGGCGACTVMVSHVDPLETNKIVHKSINACLCPLYLIEGCHVVTVEGIGSSRTGLHPVQERLAKSHGSQCGFCTPGFVMSMYSLLRSKNGEAINEEEIEENLAGNLCRCTGYRPILDAFRSFARAYSDEIYQEMNGKKAGLSDKGEPESERKICPGTGLPCSCVSTGTGCGGRVNASGMPSDQNATKGELIFPPELMTKKPSRLVINGNVTWHRPTSLEELLEIKCRIPDAKLVAGNTEIGIEVKFKHAEYKDLVSVSLVPELLGISANDSSVVLGSSVTLSNFLQWLRGANSSVSREKNQFIKAFSEQLKWFAGPSIRNGASLGGNVVTASPISDLNPLWIAANARFVVSSRTGNRSISARNFFLGYRKVDLKAGEVLTQIVLPYSTKFEYMKEFKQAQRRDDDIAIVNAGIRVKFQYSETGEGWCIRDASLVFGGVGPVTTIAENTEKYLASRNLDLETLRGALETIQTDIKISPTAPGGKIEYRRSLVASFLLKGLVHAANLLQADTNGSKNRFVSPLDPKLMTVSRSFCREPSKGIQFFSTPDDGQVVGQPCQHASANAQVTGEAQYVDDIVRSPGTLHASLVLSESPHGRIKSIDASAAMTVPGVVAIHFASDIPGRNDIGAVIHDEELFATDTVTCVGQPIGIVTAISRAIALKASRMVKIQYEDLDAILSIDDAIQANSEYEGWGHSISRGDTVKIFEDQEITIVEGEVRMGGQEHFYLEPNAHLVIPGERGEIMSFSSTQCPDKHQRYISSCLNLPMHKVKIKTKRIGGGFGGKETRAAFVNAAAAIPAYLLNKPVSLVLDRNIDMGITGHRHPFKATYKAGCNSRGEIVACDICLYCNAGNSLDLSHSVMDRAIISCDSVYNIPNFHAKGVVCKTNLPSNTAFRGFGGPQGMAVMENILDKLSQALSVDINRLKEINMYNEGDVTPYGMVLEGCQAKRCWEEAISSAGGISQRQEKVDSFNAANTYVKRGLAITPTKFGISFTTKFLNQAGALVHIYLDGTVLVTHGGVEMGQGLHTKVCQVVAQDLGVPLETVFIDETATDKIPNASPTAASASSDMYGAAAADACVQLNSRLAPFKEKMADASFKDIVKAAYLERVDLSAHGFYSTPDITGFGGARPFNYLTYGAAVTEVQLDTLTGDWHIIRSDIAMDVGNSLNPAIDIGQVEGAFVQGVGWSCLEEVVWGDTDHPWVTQKGSLFTSGPGTYKIPSVNDIPMDFRVTLLRNAPCKRTPLVHSSKAVGEPPFFLGSSVFWALKNAVYARRRDVGIHGWFQLDSPCTPERLRLLCSDMALDSIRHHDNGEAANSNEAPNLSC